MQSFNQHIEDSPDFKIISSHYFGIPKKGVTHIVHRVSNQPLCNRNVNIISEDENFLLNENNLCKACSRLYNELFDKEITNE